MQQPNMDHQLGNAVMEIRNLLSNPLSPGSAFGLVPTQTAYAALQNLRDSGDPNFLFLRSLLELIRIPIYTPSAILSSQFGAPTTPNFKPSKINQNEVELMFYCAIGVRDTFLERWDSLPKESFLYVVRDYFLCLGLWGQPASAMTMAAESPEGHLLPRVVRATLLSVAAAFWKRCWLDVHELNLPSANGRSLTDLNINPNILHMTNSLVQMIQSQVQHCVKQNDKGPIPFFKSFQSDVGPSILLFQYLESVIVYPLKQQQEQAQGHHEGIHPKWRAIYFRGASMACFMLSSLLGEISGSASNGGTGSDSGNSSRAVTRYKQTLEFHRHVFQHFSMSSTRPQQPDVVGIDGLDAILSVAMTSMSNLVQLVTVMGGNASSAIPNTFVPPTSNAVNSNDSQNVLFYDIDLVKLASGITTLTTDVISWDFSSVRAASSSNAAADDIISSTSILVKPPPRWRRHIVQPDFLSAIFTLYSIIRGQITGFKNGFSTHNGGVNAEDGMTKSEWQQAMSNLAHALRQLLLQLSSVSGTPRSKSSPDASTVASCIFSSFEEECAYAAFLVEGCLNVLTSILLYDDPNDDAFNSEWREGEAMDVCSMVSRLIQNFKLDVLVNLPNGTRDSSGRSNSFWGDGGMIHAMCTVAREMCTQMIQIVEGHHGNMDEYQEEFQWRDDALNFILEGANALLQDPWLQRHSGCAVDHAIAQAFSPLYSTYMTCRVKISRIEESYMTANEEDLDEIREEISSQEVEEQMIAISMVGRVDLQRSVACLSSMLHECAPRLQMMFESTVPTATGNLSPDCAAVLEQARMIVVGITHLLTDDSVGETPMIPEAILMECQVDGATTEAVQSLVHLCMSLAEKQASRIAITPNDPRLSPLLGKTLVCFLNRWAAAYILPSFEDYSETQAGAAALQLGALSLWGTRESAQQAISFCSTLCLHYYCFWPLESQLQEHAIQLMWSLAKRNNDIRQLLVNSPAWEQLVAVHIVTSDLRHSATEDEAKAAIYSKGVPPNTSINMVRGYQRLPYSYRGKLFSTILIGCSDSNDDGRASTFLNRSLESVHCAFTSLVEALGNNSINPQDIRARESAMLAVEMYGGIALSSEMSQPERIPQFLSPYLSDLSGLMAYYADDLSICERLLVLFCDYAEQFIVMLNHDQCVALFAASADLLKVYSAHHCASRQIQRRSESTEASFEEEQSYNDVVCAIQLLIHLGTKDFIDVCAENVNASSAPRVDSSQITDIIFFGLQQILPLMTQGLLQYPVLCSKYFSLVGFMMDTYPEKACSLPNDLFQTLIDSMLFGMCHSDPFVSKNCLNGFKGLATEHLNSNAMSAQLAQQPQMMDQIASRLLSDVVFQSLVWDRLEAAGMALLPIIATDVNRFVALVNSMAQKLRTAEQQQRLHSAFAKLVNPDLIKGVQNGLKGFEARKVRMQFKHDFRIFVKEVHSFLIMK